MFTCISCKVAFEDASEQRSHFATDWHRYNMKRRVADLPPLPAQAFNEKVLERREQNAIRTDPRGMQCAGCNKSFSTENAFRSHIQSKRHRDREAYNASRPAGTSGEVESAIPSGSDNAVEGQSSSTNVEMTNVEDQDEDEEDEEEEEDIDQKLASYRRRILPSDCLFCSTKTASIDEALVHMSRFHTFFLPHRDEIIDLSGLLGYLGEKVVIGNLCLFCPNGGKEFGSLDAVRKHMIDKGHCKLAFDTNEDRAEIQEFYQGGKGDDDWEDVDGASDGDEIEDLSGQPFISEDGLSLTLPSGRVLGHRALKIYYAQKFRPQPANNGETQITKIESVRQQLADPTQALIPRSGGSGAFGQGLEVMKARNAGEARWAKKQGSSHMDSRNRQAFKARIGRVGNNQAHFRDPLLQ